MPKIRIQTSQWFTNVGIKGMQSTAVYESLITNGPFKCQNLATVLCVLPLWSTKGISDSFTFLQGGICTLYIPDEDKVRSVASEHLEPQIPQKGDRVRLHIWRTEKVEQKSLLKEIHFILNALCRVFLVSLRNCLILLTLPCSVNLWTPTVMFKVNSAPSVKLILKVNVWNFEKNSWCRDSEIFIVRMNIFSNEIIVFVLYRWRLS